VQAGAEVVAVQVGDFEVEQAEGVGAVADDFDAVGMGHVGDLLDGHGLADPVDHVRYVDESGAGRDGLFVGTDDHGVVFDGEVEAELLVDDAFALSPLAVGLDHVGVVLLGANDFVACFEGKAVDDRVQCLGGVAVDGDLFGTRAGEVGQFLAEGFAALVEDLPHVVGGAFVGELVVALDGLLDYEGRW